LQVSLLAEKLVTYENNQTTIKLMWHDFSWLQSWVKSSNIVHGQIPSEQQIHCTTDVHTLTLLFVLISYLVPGNTGVLKIVSHIW